MFRSMIVGIDNGSTGSIGIITNDGKSFFYKTPIKKVHDYTKVKSNMISRIDIIKFKEIMNNFSKYFDNPKVILERPFVNPASKFFKATISSFRCFEATLIILDDLKIPYEFIDSKNWQKELLPKDTSGSKNLKLASKNVGIRLFPNLEKEIIKQKDADGILIAEYARRKNL